MSLIKTGAESLSVVNVMSVTAITADDQSPGIDVSGYKGVATFVATCTNQAGTNPTLDITLQGSSDDGSADTYADITGGSFGQFTDANDGIQTLDVDLDSLEGYLRLDLDIDGTNSPEFDVGVVMVARSEAN